MPSGFGLCENQLFPMLVLSFVVVRVCVGVLLVRVKQWCGCVVCCMLGRAMSLFVYSHELFKFNQWICLLVCGI
jgi:hypothetical protein